MPSSIIGFKDVLLLVIDFDFEMGYLPAVTLLFPILKFLTFWKNNIDGRPGRQRLAVEQEEEKKTKKKLLPNHWSFETEPRQKHLHTPSGNKSHRWFCRQAVLKYHCSFATAPSVITEVILKTWWRQEIYHQENIFTGDQLIHDLLTIVWLTRSTGTVQFSTTQAGQLVVVKHG